MLFPNESIHIEILGDVPIYVGIGIQVMFAFMLGGLVGLDREHKMKAAGLKTNILICLGATFFTSMSMLNLVNTGGPVDPNRIAAQIVSGIGFLGAGAIIQGKGSVIGLTTAATIWVVASIGYTIGIGRPLIATIFTLTVLVVLKLINPISKIFEKDADKKYYHLEVLSLGSVKKLVNRILFSEDVDIDEIYEVVQIDGSDNKILNILFTAHPIHTEKIANELGQLLNVEKVSYRDIDPQNG